MESPEHDQPDVGITGEAQLFHIGPGGGATVACDKARARQGLLVQPDKIWSVGKLGSPCRHTRWYYEPSWPRQRSHRTHKHTQYTVDTDTTRASEEGPSTRHTHSEMSSPTDD